MSGWTVQFNNTDNTGGVAWDTRYGQNCSLDIAARRLYDGADRWVQRTFVIADLRRSRHHRPHDGYV